jgi:hypothetical protein
VTPVLFLGFPITSVMVLDLLSTLSYLEWGILTTCCWLATTTLPNLFRNSYIAWISSWVNMSRGKVLNNCTIIMDSQSLFSIDLISFVNPALQLLLIHLSRTCQKSIIFVEFMLAINFIFKPGDIYIGNNLRWGRTPNTLLLDIMINSILQLIFDGRS